MKFYRRKAEVLPQHKTGHTLDIRRHGQDLYETRCDSHRMTEPFNTRENAERIRDEHNDQYHR
ncbi:hypothetical protein ABT093_09170 [Kitasatospora sp. NPDC002551]|uniref:hypothetical protein n=1 Tax=Kitasatospora sp. NPDC002551 TaxID=3154539 RepID=UPI0033212F0D